MNTYKTLLTKKNFLNLLIATIPLSFVLGNLAININIILICLLGMMIFKFQLFRMSEKKYQYLIYSFFIYLILITLFQNLSNLDASPAYKEHIIKSFLYLRYLILFLTINKLIEEEIFNIKFLYISCAFFSLVIALDVLIQVSFDKNIIGLPIQNNRPSSFFGSENIAGGYIQKFCLFFICLILLNFRKNKGLIYLILSSIFFLASILATGNRMPSIIFVTSIGLLFFILKETRQIFYIFITLIFISLFFGNKYVPWVQKNFSPFVTSSKEILVKLPKLFIHGKLDKRLEMDSTGYLIHFNSGISLWKKNKIFGSGLKSFRINCQYVPNQTCNTHPHNYFIEILLDVGLIGLILIYLIFFFSCLNFCKYYIKNSNFESRIIILPFFLTTFFEFFPLRSTGSFFTTTNSSIIFFMLVILINISKLDGLKKKLYN